MVEIEGITLYSVQDVAGIMGVHEVSVRNYIKAGQVKARKVFGRWVVTADEVIVLQEKMSKDRLKEVIA